MRANVCRFIDFLALRRSVIRTPPFRRTGTTRAYLLLRVAGRVGARSDRARAVHAEHAALRSEADDTAGCAAAMHRRFITTL
ncbi:hypothetical protein RVV18_001522 [Burkholderia ambifaria]|nr:hypothetical protein [Burkholderia ambifaria]